MENTEYFLRNIRKYKTNMTRRLLLKWKQPQHEQNLQRNENEKTIDYNI